MVKCGIPEKILSGASCSHSHLLVLGVILPGNEPGLASPEPQRSAWHLSVWPQDVLVQNLVRAGEKGTDGMRTELCSLQK